MRITQNHIRRIIREEIDKMTRESHGSLRGALSEVFGEEGYEDMVDSDDDPAVDVPMAVKSYITTKVDDIWNSRDGLNDLRARIEALEA